MYIQPEREREEPLLIPRNYSGNAFRQLPPMEQPPTEPTPEPTAEVAAEPVAPPSEGSPPLAQTEESISASARPAEKPQGLRGRFPFLASLLPPSRGEHKKGGILPEWALIGAVILLFLWEDEENDILPFLLLLLLWD